MRSAAQRLLRQQLCFGALPATRASSFPAAAASTLAVSEGLSIGQLGITL